MRRLPAYFDNPAAWRMRITMANFLNFYFKFIAVSQIQFCDSFDSLTVVNKVSEYPEICR